MLSPREGCRAESCLNPSYCFVVASSLTSLMRPIRLPSLSNLTLPVLAFATRWNVSTPALSAGSLSVITSDVTYKEL